MVSQDKLIKDGIRYTDKLFDEISRRLEKGVLDSDTLEEFLRKTKEYTTNNPLVSTDYDKTMINIILAETNNHKFSRPAQKELVRVTIENKVGDLIRDVGEDIKQSVRDIVTEEYNNPEGSNPQKMAKQISKKVSGIKNKRAKTIARTEIARTATISDYIIASERGATHYTVTCRSTRCPICKKMYCKSSETGGDVEYEITDTSNLPPVHPNCRCSANFFIKEGSKPKTRTGNVEPTKEQLKGNLTTSERAKYNNYKRIIDKHTKWLDENPNASLADINARKKKIAVAQEELEKLRTKALGGATTSVTAETTPKPEPKPEPEPEVSDDPFDTSKNLTKEQLDKMDFQELAEHHGAEYKGVQVYDYDDRKYHVFEQKYDNDKTLTLRFEEGAVKAYDKVGIATSNEIVHEVFKVPNALKRQTDEIWFKNTNHGIQHKYTKSRYDSLGKNVGGYNAYKLKAYGHDDPNHRIVINPKNFKGGGKGKYAYLWDKDPEDASDWKHVIHHEFTHSIDKSRESYQRSSPNTLSLKDDFIEIHKNERFFTWYSNTQIGEEFAEHGGYVSRMLMNPDEHSKKLDVKLYDAEEKKLVRKQITFDEYKEMYPEHYDYFTKLFKGEIPCY